MKAHPSPQRLWVAASLSFVVGACQCDRTKLSQSNGVPKTVAQIDFGNIRVGQTSSAALPFFNNGSAPLGIVSQTTDNPVFTVATPLRGSIPATGQSTGTLNFTPAQAGPATGTLTITDDGKPTSVVVNLRGTGVDLDLSVMPASIDFGQVTMGTTPSPSQTATFTNGNPAPVWVTIESSATAPEYSLTINGGLPPTTPIQIPSMGWLNLDVAFAPDQVAVFPSSFNYVACVDGSSTTCLAPQPFSLNGQGVTASLSVTPNPIIFGSVAQGMTAQQMITVTNTGAAPANVQCLYLQSLGASNCDIGSSTFSFGRASMNLPGALAPSASFTFPLTYTAVVAGMDTVSADYIPQGLTTTSTASAPVVGSEQPTPCSISLTPGSLTFSQAVAGTAMTQALTVKNAGGVTCNLSGIALDPTSDPAFALASGQPTSLMIAPGASGTISVTFLIAVAKAPYARKGHLTFSSSDVNHPMSLVPMLATLKSPYAGGGAWPRWHHDNTQSGLSPVDTSGLVGVVAWTASVGALPMLTGRVIDYMNSPVVGSDGTIYQVGYQGALYAFSPDGGQLWSTQLQQGPLSDPHPSTPIIANDGTVFVSFGEAFQTSFVQVSQDGGILASIPPAGGGDGFDLPPILTNGGYLVGADDITGVFAYSIAAGSVFSLVASAGAFNGSGDPISAAVGPDDTSYYCQGGIMCVSFTSPDAGFQPNPGWSGFAMPPAVAGTYMADMAFDEGFTGNLIILFGGWVYGQTTNPQLLVSVNPANGNIVWQRSLPPPTPAQSMADMSYVFESDATVGNSCPAIGSDGTIYVGNFDGLHGVDGTTGNDKPGFPFLTSGNVLTAPAVAADGTIFFGTDNGSFYAIHPDGTLRFKVSANGRVAGSPAIGPFGNVYFVADDGNLYAVN